MNDIRQEEMADQMGVSRATLINYEKGYTTINVDVLNRLRSAYPDFKSEDSENEKPKIVVENSIDFKVLFNVLSKSKRFIFSTTLLLMFLGIGLSFLFPKFYTAEISLYPAKKDLMQGLGQFQSLAMNLGMNSQQNDQDFNIPDVVKSRLIANKTMNQTWLTKSGSKITLIELWDMHLPIWNKIFRSKTNDLAHIQERAIKRFNNYINVNEDRLSGLITITASFEDPVIAASIANFIGNQVQAYIQKENSAQSTKEKLFISERLAIVKSELEISESELKDFKERNRSYEESPELFMVFSRLFREVEAKKEVYLTLQKQLELARINEVKQTPILHILDHAVSPTRKSSPNRLLFLITFAFAGLTYSFLRTIFKY